MARKSSRGKGSTFGWVAGWLGWAGLVAVGVAGGYAWRSYAPLPLPAWAGELGGKSAQRAELVVTAAKAERGEALVRAESAERRAAQADAEVDRLREQLTRLEKAQSQTAAEVADIQIREMLTAPGPAPSTGPATGHPIAPGPIAQRPAPVQRVPASRP